MTTLLWTAFFLVPPDASAGRPRPATETVHYRSGKDQVRSMLSLPAGGGRRPAVVIVHGDEGLTQALKARARQLAGQGYVVLAVDLYRGESAHDLMDAHILGRGVPDDRALADLKAAVDYLMSRPDVRPDAVGILGEELGGGYALDAALADRRIRAAVICCGRLTTDPARLTALRAPVLGLFAGKDEGIPPSTIQAFAAAMRQAGKRVAGLHVYPGARPGFLTAGDPATTAAAWTRIEAFLRQALARSSPGR